MAFIWRHLGNSSKNITKMLSRLNNNYDSVERLVNQVIPSSIKIDYPLKYSPISEKTAISQLKNTFNLDNSFEARAHKSKKFLVGMDLLEDTYHSC